MTLGSNEMPTHQHSFTVSTTSGPPNQFSPVGNDLSDQTSAPFYSSTVDNAVPIMPGGTPGSAGGNQPHGNMQPYLAVNYCICLFGIYPSRS